MEVSEMDKLKDKDKGPGALANYNTVFNGRIPVTIVARDWDGPIPGRVRVKIDADRGPYKRGETIIAGALFVTVRDCPPHSHGSDCMVCFGERE